MKLTDLLTSLPFYYATKSIKTISITNIQIDHRLIEQGDLFVCIKGFSVDGAQFARQAIQKGAVAIIAEEDLAIDALPIIIVSEIEKTLAIITNKLYGHPTNHFHLIGITGTNGKTTTSYLIDQIMQTTKKKSAVIGTIGKKIGNKIQDQVNTTPNALVLQRYFKEMLKEQVELVSMEVSSHALTLGRVYGMNFDIAVFTNLSQDHLDYHGTMTEYLQAKSLLFARLGNTYDEQTKYAVINIDDPASKQIMKSTTQQIITYGIEKQATISAKDIHYTLSGTALTLLTPVGNINLFVPLIGKFNVYNILAAVTVAILLHISLENIKRALENMPQIAGRFEKVTAGQDYTVLIDYAHTPDAISNALKVLQKLAPKRIITVVGSGGDRDKKKRPLMASAALENSNLVIFTADNPRSENPRSIIKQMLTGESGQNYHVIYDRKQAIKKAIELAEPNDIVFIAGKGHERYQEINGIRYDFDDKAVASQAIKQKE